MANLDAHGQIKGQSSIDDILALLDTNPWYPDDTAAMEQAAAEAAEWESREEERVMTERD